MSVSVTCLQFYELGLSVSVACLHFFKMALSVSVTCLCYEIIPMSVSVACRKVSISLNEFILSKHWLYWAAKLYETDTNGSS